MTYSKAGANFSGDGSMRTLLWREWPDLEAHEADATTPLSLVVVGVNPSKAGVEDDQTIRRVVHFARREGYRRVEMVNLSCVIATDPRDMLAALDGECPTTLTHALYAMTLAGNVVVAWGATVDRHPVLVERARLALEHARDVLPDGPLSFGVTKDGHPRHPSRLPNDAPLTRYTNR